MLEIGKGLWYSLDDGLLGFRVSPEWKVPTSVRHYCLLSSLVEDIHWADLFCVITVTLRHKGHKEVVSSNSILEEQENGQGLIMTY